MRQALVDRIPFSKIATVLAICAAAGMGMCGMGAAVAGAMSRSHGATPVLAVFFIAGGVLFWGSLLALMVLLLLWVALAILKAIGGTDSDA